ncbi:MAG: hypothetical protein SF187_01535 [Deltaproteobacteria bacterium]|nr:hypothetical protein [Deltaproteobacteria bacterium]
MNHIKALLVALVGCVACFGCSDAGEGTASFTTWGEEYIEQQIPPDPTGQSGFLDGWTIKYSKFLVTFRNIQVADTKGTVGGATTGSFLVDNVRPGRKTLTSFAGLKAKAWGAVSYQISPVAVDTTLVAATQADKDLMVAGGYSVYVEGTATKIEASIPLQKTFHWGFKTATQYTDCKQTPESGREIEGIVVTNGGNDVSELTTHGDHFFYDRLRASANPAVVTSLRFAEKANADRDADNEITMAELMATPLDVRTYDPSGFQVATLGDFMTALARTVGHFRGEGECLVRAVM